MGDVRQLGPLVTQTDGLRLLPSGRSTDMPWLGINKITITLSAAASLVPSDVTVTGIAVASYGPVTISGSGTTYTITLARAINVADRVTVTVANADSRPTPGDSTSCPATSMMTARSTAPTCSVSPGESA